MTPTVKPYFMQRKLRCKDPVEQQYFGGKGRGDICALCCSDEDLLTPEEVKKEKNMKGKDPLPLCGVCVELEIEAPIKKGRTTNLVEKGRQMSVAKARKRAQYKGKGVRKTQKKMKRSKKAKGKKGNK